MAFQQVSFVSFCGNHKPLMIFCQSPLEEAPSFQFGLSNTNLQGATLNRTEGILGIPNAKVPDCGSSHGSTHPSSRPSQFSPALRHKAPLTLFLLSLPRSSSHFSSSISKLRYDILRKSFYFVILSRNFHCCNFSSFSNVPTYY